MSILSGGGQDPFNFPMPNRKDLMSLQTLNPMKDTAKTTTKKFNSGRTESNNLNTSDIAGKYFIKDNNC